MSESEDAVPRPPRRKRYAGKNPQRYEDKYKEHSPQLYPETFLRVIAAGKTPAGSHVPIMVEECLAALRVSPGMTGVDATLGYGGHAKAILERIGAEGILIGLDLDPVEMPKTVARLRKAGFGESVFQAVKSNYAGIRKALTALGRETVDFVFADLGCSSMQLDDPTRGFSFKTDGPLDMRMNPARGVSAAEWLVKCRPEKLERALREHADEPRAEWLAASLAGREFGGTLEFAGAIREAMKEWDDPTAELAVRRVFQAVRIAVNEEFTALDAFLKDLPGCLKSGGRAAILTFHSGEDRRVKHAFKAGLRNGQFREISDGVTVASDDEQWANPRSSPAKLRWAIKA